MPCRWAHHLQEVVVVGGRGRTCQQKQGTLRDASGRGFDPTSIKSSQVFSFTRGLFLFFDQRRTCPNSFSPVSMLSPIFRPQTPDTNKLLSTCHLRRRPPCFEATGHHGPIILATQLAEGGESDSTLESRFAVASREGHSLPESSASVPVVQDYSRRGSPDERRDLDLSPGSRSLAGL